MFVFVHVCILAWWWVWCWWWCWWFGINVQYLSPSVHTLHSQCSIINHLKSKVQQSSSYLCCIPLQHAPTHPFPTNLLPYRIRPRCSNWLASKDIIPSIFLGHLLLGKDWKKLCSSNLCWLGSGQRSIVSPPKFTHGCCIMLGFYMMPHNVHGWNFWIDTLESTLLHGCSHFKLVS